MVVSKIKKAGSKTGSALKSVLDGSFLGRENIVKSIPFFLFLGMMGTLLIGNTYVAERNSRRVETAKIEISELRIKQKLKRSELLRLSNQSDVSQRLATRGLVPSTEPPTTINIIEKPKGFLSRIFNRGNNEN